MQLKTKQAFYAMFIFLMVCGFLEITLGLLAFVSPKVERILGTPWISHTVPDERLGYRPNPAYLEHDSKGFRNPEVPSKAQIVALGDSQTYGTSVDAKDAWPRRLESMIGKTVYSMAYGGYGPVHSLILWDEAVALQPNVVIEAFYAGNDLFDSFNLVYNFKQLPELKSFNPTLQASVIEAEQSEPITEHLSRMHNRMYNTGKPKIKIVTREGFFLWRFLSKNSKIYGLLRRTKYESLRLVNKLKKDTAEETWKKEEAFGEMYPAYFQIYNDGNFKTIFTSEHRLSALDLGDPRIEEGHQISLKAIKRMHELAAAKNIRFLVLLIPTKETVFREIWKQPTSMSYRRLTEKEELFWDITKNYLKNSGIEYLDTLPVLREQLAKGIQPYMVTSDGHPNEHGHNAIAKQISTHLGSQ